MWTGLAVALFLAQSPVPELISKARQAMISGELHTAEQLLQQAVTAEPKANTARFLLGFCFYLENDFASAEKTLAAADPKDARVNLYRALAQEGLGRTDDAIEFYKRASSSDSRNTEIHAAWARLLRKRGDPMTAEALVDQALAIEPANRDLLYLKGQCLFDRGEYAKAAGAGERALTAQGAAPSEREVRFLLARAWLKAGDPARAANHRKVFESLPMPLVR